MTTSTTKLPAAKSSATIRLTVLPEDGRPVDDEHVKIVAEMTTPNEWSLVQLNARLRKARRPAMALLGGGQA